MALGDIPFYGAYLQRRQMQEQEQANQLGTAVKFATLQQHFEDQETKRQAAERLRAFQTEIAAAPTPEAKRAVAMKYATPDSLIKATEPQAGFTIGDTRYDASGRPIVTNEKPAELKAPPSRTRIEGEVQVMEELQPDGTWREVGRGPRFARQVAPSITQEAPITPVTLQDPNDPTGTIVVDGRTNRVIGKGPKLTDTGKMEAKRRFNMQGIGATIQSAENILKGEGGKALPTGSGFGTALDYAGSLIGITPEGAKEADQLRALSGALVAKMPRMEGPQSDKDVQLYREAAGRVGDSTIPVPRRIAALEKVKELWAKYERLNPDQFDGGQPAAPRPAAPAPGLPSAADIDAELARRRGRGR